ncbi:MAG TPA: hypothetical protein VFM77_01060 [Terriglobales bacterium]|nr:hypothetical protein [Terriglobales bacterium]
MQVFLEVFFVFLAAWFIWSLVRKIVRPRTPAEPADEPFAEVPVPVKRGPKGLAGAVALEEPVDDDPSDTYPPRCM